MDIVYRYVAGHHHGHPGPATAAEARARLEAGNSAFAAALSSSAGDTGERFVVSCDRAELGESANAPKQAPFAAVLGCADARVPTEIVFSQAWNELFVVRVAGNVLGNECLGSLDYANAHLGESLRLLVVLGHSGCGAVAATVDSFLTPANYLDLATSHSLRTVVDKIAISVRAGVRTLENVYGPSVVDRPGFRNALVETAVVVHAALTAHTLEQEFKGRSDCEVAFGIYDLSTGRVGMPGGGDNETRLVSPPTDTESFASLLRLVVSAETTRHLLDGGS